MKLRYNLFIAVLTLFIFSCSDDSDTVNPSNSSPTTPWELKVQSGNFAINSKDIVINDDGSSLTYMNYYVFQSEIPATDLEFYSLVAYIPTDITDYVTELKNVTAVASYNEGQSTGNIYFEGEFIQTTKLFGSDHSAYRLTARDTNFSANQITFQNIVFTFDVLYKDIVTGSVKHTRTNSQEVYMRL